MTVKKRNYRKFPTNAKPPVRWTKEELDNLNKLILELGRDCNIISQNMPTKTKKQVIS